MKPVYKFLDACKSVVRAAVLPIAKGLNVLSRGKLRPETITITSLVMHVPIAVLIARGYYGYAAAALLVFGLFDALDGSLARVQGTESKRGMLLDSVTDRMKEVILYTGAAVAIVRMGHANLAYWAVIACGASLCVSYINAWGEALTSEHAKPALNRAFRSGLARFEVRMFILILGLAFSQPLGAVVVIAVLSTITVIERLVQVERAL